MARVRLAASAQEDLRDIRVYSKAAHGPAIARDYLQGLRKAFDLLGDRPRVGVEETDLGIGVRSFSYRLHRIYFQLDTQGIVIIRILHQAQDRRTAFGQAE
ncbi:MULTISPECIES: type II toxin-antitoxin system RelE/ParE family toxin [Sphingomonas]|uniref:type II toxin-antitoxin system RelE/ParE family toxin n=1 Tax=Sphingomonas TaxID=13687 RepID=UPI00082ADDE9|nr:type II toxin-antitoxin system RelE/ParE family toxin [Sphingomonas sp. CCH10-B3]